MPKKHITPKQKLELIEELRLLRAHLEQHQRLIMKSFDDLSAAVAAQSGIVTDLASNVDAVVTEVQSPGPTDQQLAAITSAVNNTNTILAAQNTRLVSVLNPPAPANAAV
jgi:hypothetical protein